MIDGHAYRFETKAQLAQCLRMGLSAHRRLAPATGKVIATLDCAPVELIAALPQQLTWLDSGGVLRSDGDCPGPTLGAASRLALSGGNLCALAGETLLRIDAATLQVLDTTATPGAIDIAGDGSGGVWLLTAAALTNIVPRGWNKQTPDLPALTGPALTGAARIAAVGESLFLLDPGAKSLHLLRVGKTALRIAFGNVTGEPDATFAATDIVSGDSLVLLTGSWGAVAGFLGFDADGNLVCSGVWDGAALAVCVVPLGEALVAAFAEGAGWTVRLFARAASGGGGVLLTPTLESDTLAGEWRRAQVLAALPVGATLAVDWASTGDEALAAIARSILADDELSGTERRDKLRAILTWADAPITYAGVKRDDPAAPEPFAVPLGDTAGNFLWLEVAILRNQAETAPSFQSLAVQHDLPGLMDYLPAVFRTPNGDSDGTLRRLVEVLEATFLGFDDTIGKLADRFDPARTEARCLASLAALLGLPFDEALDTAQRRGLLGASSEILAGRGTRAGILALLRALLGDRPYRVVDRTAQSIPITLGGGTAEGGRLPGFLAGPSARVPKLNARLVLGKTLMSAFKACDETGVTRGPSLLVAVPLRPAELRRFGEALRQMIEAMVPAGVRLELRWTEFGLAAGGPVLSVMDDWPVMIPGAGMRPGAARLGGSSEPRLRGDGVALAQRLD
jgi:phage tail-like protein